MGRETRLFWFGTARMTTTTRMSSGKIHLFTARVATAIKEAP
jgi:hypothetical protein